MEDEFVKIKKKHIPLLEEEVRGAGVEKLPNGSSRD
jgi:hypothetical protein